MFHISYEVKSSKNLRLEEEIFTETLKDAVDSYCPDADLFIQINGCKIEIDVCRDMYGLHEDLLGVLKCLAFDLPSDGPYRSALEPIQPDEKLYTLIFPEFYIPRIIYFLSRGKYVYLQTRTLHGDAVVASPEDVIAPIASMKKDVIVNSCIFLQEYLRNLIEEIPTVADLEDYKEYLAQLEKNQLQVSSRSENNGN